MKKRLLLALILLVTLPLAGLGILGIRLAAAERTSYEQDRSALLLAQLRQHDASMASLLSQRIEDLRRASADSTTPEALEEGLQATGLVRHSFFIDEQGGFRAPVLSNAGGDTSEFYNRIITLWRNHDPAFIPPSETQAGAVEGGIESPRQYASSASPSSAPSSIKGAIATLRGQSEDYARAATEGWYAWYEEDGMHLLAWWRERSGRILGAELDRVRLMADLIG
ncbi:MAG: hypothetical protein IT368_00955, partial [Candidatus Hydrogenedentes bacterium]|nr:hypothetical protein [Candidatus Hydrogenedentota bacterium]